MQMTMGLYKKTCIKSKKGLKMMKYVLMGCTRRLKLQFCFTFDVVSQNECFAVETGISIQAVPLTEY